MKKFRFNRAVSLLLMVVILCVALSSCKIHILNFDFNWEPPFPEGYTGGLPVVMDGTGLEVYLFETYDELMTAVNSLKSHGSTFEDHGIVNCDEKEFDVKYILTLSAFESDKIIKQGEDPFNRRATNVTITSYIFFEAVSAEELAYSSVDRYDCYSVSFTDKELVAKAKSNFDLLRFVATPVESRLIYILRVDGKECGRCLSRLDENGEDPTELTEEHIKIVIDTVEFIEFED